tara:strand:+ start:909 stop:1781 length:873 start_codon:yes stop_codon:yes gene_type:complete
MKKVIILMPVYNDWESFNKLIGEINSAVDDIKDYKFECIVVNDCSTSGKSKIIKPKNFNSLKVVNMKKNQGHARCNAAGLRYINKNESFDYVIVMDSDGEDRPVEVRDLIKKIIISPNTSVVAKRIKRSEGLIFQTLYHLHKLITLIFTGKKINFGNYCCLTKKDINLFIDKKSIWSSFSGTVKKNVLNLNEVDSIRGLRYFGPSKMSLFNLAIHSFSIIAVFKYTVILRSILMIVALSFFIKIFGSISFLLQISIVFFNLMIFAVSLRENQEALLKSNENILNVDDIIH